MGDQNNYIDCQYNLYNTDESSCNGCSVVQSGIRSSAKPTQEQLWDQTGISAGLYAMDISSLTSSSQRIQSGTNINWNQMSDRQLPGVQTAAIPSHGSSTRGNVTRLRPGSLSPGGAGVDVKHGSYLRYLNIKKAKNLRAHPEDNNLLPLYGNKTRATNAVRSSENCNCSGS